VVQNPEVDARGVNQRGGPRELDAVDARFDGQQPMLSDHGDVFRVVNRQLHAFARRNRHQVDIGQHRGHRDKQ